MCKKNTEYYSGLRCPSVGVDHGAWGSKTPAIDPINSITIQMPCGHVVRCCNMKCAVADKLVSSVCK